MSNAWRPRVNSPREQTGSGVPHGKSTRGPQGRSACPRGYFPEAGLRPAEYENGCNAGVGPARARQSPQFTHCRGATRCGAMPAPPFQNSSTGARGVTRRIAGALAFLALATLAGCGSIHSGGYENYMHAALEHQIMTQAGLAAARRNAAPAALDPPPGANADPPALSTGPLQLSLHQAVIMGLTNNPSLVVQRFSPAIAQLAVVAQRGVFDPVLTAQATAGKSRLPGSGASDTEAAQAGVAENLPTGTSIQAGVNTNFSDMEGSGAGQSVSTGASLTVTQALLQGASLRVNLAAIREAQIGRRISDYELRGVAQSITYQVVQAYWAYAQARQNVAILRRAVTVAKEQEHQTRELIRVGRTAASELPAAAAEVATNREQLIAAQGELRIARLTLLSLIIPAGGKFWTGQIHLLNQPRAPKPHVSARLSAHAALALRLSPLLNEARLQIEDGQLQVVQTRDGLLPKLDLFLTLGQTGYSAAFSRSVSNLAVAGGYSVFGGLQFSHPVFNRTAEANYQSAELGRDEDEAALANLVRTVELSVRTAYIQMQTARQEIVATRATRRAQAEALRATTAQFQAGTTTSLQVALAQNNLLAAQLAEVQAVVSFLDAEAQLYLQEGSILQRLSVQAPGAVPIKPIGPAWLRRWPDGSRSP